jgi:hypothetical protein
MAIYTGWWVVGLILATVAVGGALGVLVASSKAGMVRGATCGFLLSLVAILATTFFCLSAGYVGGGEGRTPDSPRC